MWKLIVILLALPAIALCQNTKNNTSLTDTVKMSEVVVSSRSAVKVNGDTITYSVDSLNKNPNATAEEVLKKIPGVEITSDGKILANGKEITKIFINGKLYTSEDIRTLTQNMPAEVLEKMQVADWYDEESQFTGIKKGKSMEKMLNLKIKKNYERGTYGQLIGGMGTKKTYQAGTFTNYMSHDTRITLIAKANNTGLQDVGITNSGNADNTRTSTPNATGITTRRIADISFSNDKGKKLKLSGSYYGSYNNNTQQQSSLRNTYLPGDSSLLQKQDKNVNSITNSHRLTTRSEWAIDSMYSMQTDAGLSYRNTQSNNTGNDGTYYNTTDNINFTRNSVVQNNTEGHGVNFANSLRKKFIKKRRTASFDAGINYNNDKTEGNNDMHNQYYNPSLTNDNNYTSTENKNTLSTRLGLSYNEPIGEKNTVSLTYRNNYSSNENDRNVNSIYNNTMSIDTLQTRMFSTYNTEHNVRLGHQYKSEKLRTNIELALTPFSRSIIQKGYTVDNHLSQTATNYQSAMYISYDFAGETAFSLHYNTNIRQPDILQLQTIPDYRDSLNIVLGNSSLSPEINNGIYFNFYSTQKGGNRNVWVTLNGSWNNNKIINKTDINASKRITTPVNANGYFNIGYNTGYYLKAAKWIGVTISSSGSYSNGITITNGQLQNIPSQYLSFSSKLIMTTGKWYDGDINYNFNISSLTNSTGTTNTLQRHTITTTGTFTIPFKIRFIYFLNYIHNEGITASYNPDFILINTTLEKTFKKPKGVVLRAQGFDVFNNYPNVQRIWGDNFYEDRNTNRLGRFFIFSLIYKFSYFPNKTLS